jgi:anti-sigma regulatory factor (Ser/Thr protein kinase)
MGTAQPAGVLIRQGCARVKPCLVSRGARVEWCVEPGDAAAVSRIRHRIMDCLSRVAAPDADLDSANLVVAELLANALAHTRGPAWVSLRWDGSHPLLSVADSGPGMGRGTVVGRLPTDPMATGGRGLYLVSTLALDVAVAPRAGGGSVISVTLDLMRRSSSPAPVTGA